MKTTSLLLISFFLSGCVSGSFGNHQEIEDYPLRGATKEEGQRLKRCLKAAHRAQETQKQKTGKYTRHTRDLPIDDVCQGFKLAQKRDGEGLEIMAQFNEGESTVRWSINHDGVIEEHLDPEAGPDLDLEF